MGANSPRKKLFIMGSQTIDRLEVLNTKPGQLYELLDRTEAKLRQIATIERCAGILVARHDPSRYSLVLSETVPFGETWEWTLS